MKLRFKIGHLAELHLSPFKNNFSPARRHFLHCELSVYLVAIVMINYTLLGFFAFGPLCGTGVASKIEVISIP